MNSSKGIFNLEGKVAIVTGITGKFGPYMAQALLEHGATHVAGFSLSGNADKNPVLRDLIQSGFNISVHQVDVTSEEAVRNGVARVIGEHGPVTILINNAGIDVPPDSKPEDCGLFIGYPFETWKALIDSHVHSTFLMCREVAKSIARQEDKPATSIINVGSTYGLVAPEHKIYSMRPGFVKPVAYSAAKGAIISMTRALAEQLAEHNIRVNVLIPGGIDHNHPREFYDAYAEHTMLGRMGEYDDLFGPVVFLASKASKYMTGAALVVDGGWTAK